MAPLNLKKLLGRDGPRRLSFLLAPAKEPIAVIDLDGNLLWGKHTRGSLPEARIALAVNDQVVGWVTGRAGSDWLASAAALIEYMLTKEMEKRDLAAEVLDKYRELHLLYRLSEKLTASLQPEAIARMALSEVCPLIQASGGMVVLRRESSQEFVTTATCGEIYSLRQDIQGQPNLVYRVLSSGLAELANGLPAGDYFTEIAHPVVSLLCAPLKTEKGVLGVILLVGAATREFTAGELKLVNAIAMQAAPAIEIAHLHQLELEKERLERDLQTARQVQSALLPHHMPVIPGWGVSAHWQPAREVSGDFYEFLHLPNDNLSLAIADVTGKGMPAALVMANTRSVLRAVAATQGQQLSTPGAMLAQVNDILCEDMPRYMFVTCLLVFLDPRTGAITFANAGHNLPYLRSKLRVSELRATGVPLGLFPETVYEDQQAVMLPGDSLLMYSDGLTEAHNLEEDLFGNPRLQSALEPKPEETLYKGQDLIQYLLQQLAEFTGPKWEQEDDVTFVVLDRAENL
jgi:serine phosphatase RsbU (regulator of sigma subunit)